LDDLNAERVSCSRCWWVRERERGVLCKRVAERVACLTVDRGGVSCGCDSGVGLVVAVGD